MLARVFQIPSVLYSIPKRSELLVRFCSQVSPQNPHPGETTKPHHLPETAKLRETKNSISQTAESGEAKNVFSQNPTMNKNFMFYGAEKKVQDPSKPLVLLFQWLYAKPTAVQRYCSLYHDIGLDVLAVRGKLSHFLWPPDGFKLSDELFEYLKANRPADEKLLVHAFSIGAYNYTLAMQAAHEQQEETGHFRERVIGQIFDSIVIGSYDNMSNGIVQSLPDNKAFREIVVRTLHIYYNVTRKTTKETYDRLVQDFKNKPLRVPTLFFYSQDDPMCNNEDIEKMISNWQSQWANIYVGKVSWPKSTHAAHFRDHKEDYLLAWSDLMRKLKLLE